MPKLSLDFVLKATQGKKLSDRFGEASRVTTDTRKDLSQSVFVALRGSNYDAHNFLDQAVQGGAHILIIDNEKSVSEDLKKMCSTVLVKGTLVALQNLAQAWRRKLSTKILSVTGSNGKTTTKEFANIILGTQFKTYASPGSFNNHWGVPISLLSIEEDVEVAIIEMGMNKRGEIQRLCEIAEPEVTLVTMVGSAHIGELGSQEEIAKAKNEIYENSPKSFKIFNIDNEFTIKMHEHFAKRLGEACLTFSSFNKEADVFLRAESLSLNSLKLSGKIKGVAGSCEVPVFGRHNVNNIMGAACLALSCGMTSESIWKALPLCKSIWGRNQLMSFKNGAQILFDAYNASFDSTTALVKCLYEFDFKGAKVAILGQMLELGNNSEDLHRKLGELVAQTGFETVWFIGKDKEAFSQGMQGGGFEKNLLLSDSYKEALAKKVGLMLNPSDIAIIKGSRGMKMEQVLETWREQNLL